MGERLPRRLAAATIVCSLAITAVGCAADPPDPAEVRRQQVETRLARTFSPKQTSCILGALDDATVAALTRSSPLDPSTEEFKTYSNVVLLCTRPDASVDTTPAATTSITNTDG